MYTYAIPWQVALFVSLPEAFLIVILGFALFNLEISYKKAFIISLITSVIVYFARQMHVIFGIHTLIGLITMVITGTWLTNLKPWAVLISILTGSVVMGALQSIIIFICFYAASANLQELATNPWLNVFFFFPIGVTVALLYFLIRRYKFCIFSLNFEDRKDA